MYVHIAEIRRFSGMKKVIIRSKKMRKTYLACGVLLVIWMVLHILLSEYRAFHVYTKVHRFIFWYICVLSNMHRGGQCYSYMLGALSIYSSGVRQKSIQGWSDGPSCVQIIMCGSSGRRVMRLSSQSPSSLHSEWYAETIAWRLGWYGLIKVEGMH